MKDRAGRTERGASLWGERSLVALAYAAVTAAFFVPLLDDLARRLIGPPEDNLRYLWTLWWGHGALRGDLGDLLFTDMILHPQGTSLRYNDYSWYNLLLALPLRAFFGAPATYNLLVLHGFVLAGVGASMLCREFGAGRIAAFAGGAVFAFSPMHVAQAQHHLNIASIQWIPFFVLFFLRSLRTGRRRDIVLAAVCFLLNALCSWNHLVFTSLLVALAVLWRGLCDGLEGLGTALRTALLTTAVPLGILAVWLVPMAREGHATGGADIEGHAVYVVDALGPLVPHYRHALARLDFVRELNAAYVGLPWESVGYLGFAALLLAGLAVVRRAPGAVPAAIGAGAFLILALGSELHVRGTAVDVPMPYQVIEALPFVSGARVPGRAMVFVYLFLGVLVAGGIDHVCRKVSRQAAKPLALGATLLLVADYYSPFRASTPVHLPEAYGALAGDPDDFAILDLPLTWVGTNRYMMYQTLHGLPIVGGQLPRRTSQSTVDAIREQGLAYDWTDLVEQRVKYIVVHRDAGEPASLQHYDEVFAGLGFAVVHDTADALVVRTY